jgi:hypothetical protein
MGHYDSCYEAERNEKMNNQELPETVLEEQVRPLEVSTVLSVASRSCAHAWKIGGFWVPIPENESIANIAKYEVGYFYTDKIELIGGNEILRAAGENNLYYKEDGEREWHKADLSQMTRRQLYRFSVVGNRSFGRYVP